jgi:16S rRNA (uracil1498-N3)-methyltransferase
MRIPRLYLDAPLAAGQAVELDVRAHRHAVQVLRLREGSPLVLFNGDGRDYLARIETVERRNSRALVKEVCDVDRESPLQIVLVQGVSKGEHMDLSVQKAVELGVAAIQPVLTQRSVTRLDAARWEKKQAHWQGILIGACEQCGRAHLPVLHAPVELSRWLQAAGRVIPGWVLDPAAEDTRDQTRPEGPLHLLVGPEGGLTEQELAQAVAAGFRRLRLGPRTLRTETASTVAIATAQLLWGDLGR